MKPIEAIKNNTTADYIGRRLILPLLILIVLSSFSMADFGYNHPDSPQQTIKKDECIHLTQTCPNCDSVNLTSVRYPDSTKALESKKTQKQGTEFNYTFCDTYQVGKYIVNGVGDPNNTQEVFAYNFKVTENGAYGNNLIVPILILSIIFSIGVLNYFTLYRKNRMLGGLMFITLSFTLMLPELTQLSEYIILLTYPLIGVSILTFIYDTFFEKKHKRLQDTKMPFR